MATNKMAPVRINNRVSWTDPGTRERHSGTVVNLMPDSGDLVVADGGDGHWVVPCELVTVDTKLSEKFAQAAGVTVKALNLRGKALEKAMGDLRTLMSEARDIGIYYRDDNVERVEQILKGDSASVGALREMLTRLNTLRRCAEWVEHTRGEDL